MGEIYYRNHDARQLVTKVQAHPCFPEQTRHRQALAISFCMVSKSFFQTISLTLQVCPSGSSGQVLYVASSLSADNPLCEAVPVFHVSALVIWKPLRAYGLIPAQLYSTANCLGQLLQLSL